MVKIRLGINNSFALRRWTRPKQWMEVIYSTLELDMCELSFDLLDPTLREPTKTDYMQEMLELGDEFPVDLISARTGPTQYKDDLLLHPNLGNRIESIQWFEQAIDVAAYSNSSFIGGYFGGLVIQNHTFPSKLDYAISFLIDSIDYLCSIAYTAGLFGLFIEPFSLVNDRDKNRQLNHNILNRLREQSKISISISPVAQIHNLNTWFENSTESIHVVQIQDVKNAKHLKSIVNSMDSPSKHTLNVILNLSPSYELSEQTVLAQIKSTINEIQEILSSK